MSKISILCNQPHTCVQAEMLAAQLNLPLLKNITTENSYTADYVLVVSDAGLVLQQTGTKVPGPVSANFIEGAVAHRRLYGGGKGQMIAKAVGIKSGVYPRVLDATAGLGKDSFVLASLGCEVLMAERSAVVHALLQDGLERALSFAKENDRELLAILQRMRLLSIDSHQYLSALKVEHFLDVIYLDPMFPERQKSAEVKKEMTTFHDIVGADEDADGLLPLALSHVNYRVVVKRPRKAPFLNNQHPSYQLEGKSSRFDIYTIKKMPEKLSRLHDKNHDDENLDDKKTII
jgi:16S rRNA (guanine1516-N2)-methyltransferase